MLTLTQLAYIRDKGVSAAERAAVWRTESGINTTQLDAERVVFLLQGDYAYNRELAAAARELNKYLDHAARFSEDRVRGAAELEDIINGLRAELDRKAQDVTQLHRQLADDEASTDVEIAGLRQQLAAVNDEREALRVAHNLGQLKLTDIQSQRDALAAQMEATTDLTHRLRSDHAQADAAQQQAILNAKQTEAELDVFRRRDKERSDNINTLIIERDNLRTQLALASAEVEDLKTDNHQLLQQLSLGGAESQQQRAAIRQLEERISELQTQLNKAEVAQQETKIMPTEGLTPVPGLQYAVRDVEAAPPAPLSEDLLSINANLRRELSAVQRDHQDLRIINDNLRQELAEVKRARDHLTETRATMIREYHAVVKENHELRQSRAELLQAARLRAALPEEKAPSLRNVDAELHAITEAIPLFANLDPTACDRILNYLGNRFALVIAA